MAFYGRALCRVSPNTVTYDSSVPQNQFTDRRNINFPRILQFHVDKGVQYTVRASGIVSGRRPRFFTEDLPDTKTSRASAQNYLLSFSMVKDDFADTPGNARARSSLIFLQGTQLGSIETPGDADRIKLAAPESGYTIVALRPTQGPDMQGRLTFPSTPIAEIDRCG